MIDQILSRSFIYDSLALALEPLAAETINEFLSEKTRMALPQVAAMAGAGSAPGFVTAVTAWAGAFETMTPEKLIETHTRLFGHTARGVVCPYETEFGQEGEFQQPRQLGQIAGYYRAFGLAVRADERERPDHISCELEFLAFLSRKEAYAINHNDDQMLAETRKAFRLFMRNHVGRFGRAFACLLAKEDPGGFFGRLGGILYEFITMECRRLDLEAGAPLLPLRDDVDEAPMMCAPGETR